MTPSNDSAEKARRRALHIREHLANERTLLSWIRLGLSLAALGFVIARFGIYLEQLAFGGQTAATTPQFSIPIGVTLVLLGPLAVALAARRFFQTEREIDEENAQPQYTLLYIMLAAVVISGIILAAYLVYVWLAVGV